MPLTTNLRNIVNKSLVHRFNKIALQSSVNSSTSAFLKYEKDPGANFTSEDVQQSLKSMTRVNLDTVFRKRAVSDNSTEYKFMTTEQLEKEFRKIAVKAEEYLQMPPVVMVKPEEHTIISKDPALSNFSNTKYVVADITFGLKQSERKVVIRHTDGTLEYAPHEVKKRINQTYFPIAGRKIHSPTVFEASNLQRCLEEGKYEFLLDRLCIQFEPYEQEYHNISSKIYTHINESKQFDCLRSTRHFGPMAFFLAWHKIIDDLLYDMIKRDFLRNGVELILLAYKLNSISYDAAVNQKLAELPKPVSLIDQLKKSLQSTSDDIHSEIQNAIGKSREDFQSDEVCLEIVETFVKNQALKKVPLELAIQTFRETNDEKKKLYEGLRKAHGVA